MTRLAGLSPSFALLTALSALGAAACTAPASADADVGPTKDEVVQTKTLTTDVDDSIVAVTSPNKPSWICSGSVIAPRVVLTAAHCVEGGNSDKAGWSFEVYFGKDRNQPKPTDHTIKVKEFHFPTQYREMVLDASRTDDVADDFDGDIAVLILEEPTTAPPMAWNRAALDDALVGKDVRFVGYGLDGSKDNPASKNGVRKTATLPVESISDGAVAIVGGKVNPCHGDSGGPLLLEEDGRTTILGVGHMMNDESCEAGANYERTDKYVEFIQGFLDETR